jgi:hypothetical protein
MVCTFLCAVKRKEIREVDLWGKSPFFICQTSNESCGIKTYPALLMCLKNTKYLNFSKG